MRFVPALAIAALVAPTLLTASPARAANISFEHIASTGSGRTSSRGTASTNDFNTPGCALPGNLDVVTQTGTLSSGQGAVANQRKPALLNSSCYLAIGFGILVLNLGRTVRYAGFEWSSIDEYNGIEFFDAAFTPISFGVLGTFLSGTAVALALGVLLYTDLFINFTFGVGEGAQYVRFSSTNSSLEFDNWTDESEAARALIVSQDQSSASPAALPAPAGLALFGLGALALAGRRHRR